MHALEFLLFGQVYHRADSLMKLFISVINPKGALDLTNDVYANYHIPLLLGEFYHRVDSFSELSVAVIFRRRAVMALTNDINLPYPVRHRNVFSMHIIKALLLGQVYHIVDSLLQFISARHPLEKYVNKFAQLIVYQVTPFPM